MAKISPKNSKLGKIPNISLIPVADCPSCDHCKKDCYALKAWKQYPAVRDAWRHNSEEARSNPTAFFNALDDYLEKKKPKFFRIHVAGDFFATEYYQRWTCIAESHPGTKFLAFTKAWDNIPHAPECDNFTLVISRWVGDDEPPAHLESLPQAWVQDGTETRAPSDAIECPGVCDDCGMCWALPSIGRDVVFNVH